MFLPNSRPYYIAPAYPMLMAAGAVVWEAWLSRPRLQWLKPAYVVFFVRRDVDAVFPPNLAG
jgi:hypothetical protein